MRYSDNICDNEHINPDRRKILKLAAGAITGEAAAVYALRDEGPAIQLKKPVATPDSTNKRARESFDLRIAAAQSELRRPIGDILTNGDESRYSNFLASYSKGLPHTATGEVDRSAFRAFVKALNAGRAGDLEAIPTAGDIRQVNPQAAYAFTFEGPDPQALNLDAPPRFDSPELAAEACELYWQALTRDVPFDEYSANPTIAGACEDLSRMTGYRGPRLDGKVTPAILFRGPTPGDLTGPYISQFLWKEVPYGAIRLVPYVRTATPGIDYLVAWDDWLAVQNGAGTVSRHAGAYRYIRSARDLTAYVQLDFSYQAFLTACLVLFGMEGTTDVRRAYKGAPFDSGIPYRTSRSQSGFITLGVAHALDLVARVASLALKHAWYHKWLVHRFLRPEEYGGRLHQLMAKRATYPIHEDLLASPALTLIFNRYKTHLLPQAFPEGCPLHPSYPSGHATIAGACATVLKAFFDESFPIEEPVLARRDGLTLEPYRGPALTVGGELNKLAFNVAMGRSAAGIHWRSDNMEGLTLGENVALSILAEMRSCLHERFEGFSLTRFDGTRVTI